MKLEKFRYPKSKKINIKNTYFETEINDPYQWLENNEANDTKEWICLQKEITDQHLNKISNRCIIESRLKYLWSYKKQGAPFTAGHFKYFYRNNGLQNQSILYRHKKGSSDDEIFLDPNSLSKDGTISMSEIVFSPDGSLAAYQLSEDGSDWQKIFIIKSDDKSIIDGPLTNVKFSRLAWNYNYGLYYSKYQISKGATQQNSLAENHRLYYHLIGNKQSSDELVFGSINTPRRFVVADVTENNKYLIILATNLLTGNELYIKKLDNPASKITNIINDFDSQNFVIDSIDSSLIIRTNRDSPNFRIVKADLNNPLPENWIDLVEETSNVIINAFTGGNKIFIQYLQNASSAVKQYSIDGDFETDVKFPSQGSVDWFSCKRNENEIYYSFSSFTTPNTIYRYNIAKRISQLYHKPNLEFDHERFESKQIFYTSKDGIKIPMTITHKKGLQMDGKRPTLLHSYGGFGHSMVPTFSISNIILLEQNGIYAVPNLRGGGEYGENWHKAGRRLNKQNAVDDLIAGVNFLFDNHYTSSNYLAISGVSNGGLIVGSAIAKKPTLCKVAFPVVGVFDMLRYNKFTAGVGWSSEYGTAEESKAMFEYLLSYSPYHCLEPNFFPSVLLTTGVSDDRVVPAHSFKFCARLQEYQMGENPILIRIISNSGHGAGKSTSQIIQEETDKLAFMFENMGIQINSDEK